MLLQAIAILYVPESFMSGGLLALATPGHVESPLLIPPSFDTDALAPGVVLFI